MTEPAHCFSRRFCTSCLGADRPGVPAVYVATDPDGVSWYECENHEPTDNTLETVRTSRELIVLWAERHGLSSSRRPEAPSSRRPEAPPSRTSCGPPGRRPEDAPSRRLVEAPNRTPLDAVQRSLSCVSPSGPDVPGEPSCCRRCGTWWSSPARPLCPGPYTRLERGAIVVAVAELPLIPDPWTP